MFAYINKKLYLCAVFCNGKELVESPSNEYNVYDYGFREYYAAIGRFMTMDPLAEMTPWKSPYSYAGNNFVNKTDYMGLFEDYPTNPDGSPCYTCGDPYEFVHNNDNEWQQFNKDGSPNWDWWEEHGGGGGYNFEYDPNITWRDFFNPLPSWINISENGYNPFWSGPQTLNWVAVDKEGNIVDMNLGHWDKGVYVVDGTWDGSHWDLMRFKVVGCQGDYDYKIGEPIAGRYNTEGGGYMLVGHFVEYGTSPASNPELLLYAAGLELYDYLYEHPMVADALSLAGDIGKKVSKIPGLRCLGWVGYLLAANQFKDLVKAWQSGNVTFDLKYHTASTIVGFIPGLYSKGAALLMDGGYVAAEKASNMCTQLDAYFMDPNTWGYMYETGSLPYIP